jgi:hypothetical protein
VYVVTGFTLKNFLKYFLESESAGNKLGQPLFIWKFILSAFLKDSFAGYWIFG